ncbi:MAG: bifunctional phosphoribosylaminoimidazolecarboxamide formyltransferase/IMP cyclohydrolase [Lautropia sp.]|nr:bifunctional phosphoribosylaminoimidazolecarboxamide formyltransferase/IMP cyclohydrolase [Lautropia sp.]
MSIKVHASGVNKPADLPATPVTRALISVFDKTGVLEFAHGLHKLGIEILSTGGTAKMLDEAGIPVIEVSDYTGFPEMLDGRVKTLHPKVHGGLLARRDLPAHMSALEQHNIGRIDLLAVNLYPFQQTVARPDVTLDEAIENIDIGGPAMLRAAAKNHAGVTVVVDPGDYAGILQQLQTQQAVAGPTRYALAAKAFAHTARYDGAVANHLSSIASDGTQSPLPATLTLQFEQRQPLRYGENPHQYAAFYQEANPAPGTLATYQQLQGKELSYNNIADADAAWECVRAFEQTACVIIKHANPCGVAVGSSTLQAYRLAFATDPVSAFGGIIAFNRPIDGDTAQAVSQQFVEVLLAPGFSEEARAIMKGKPNVRLLELPMAHGNNHFDLKRVGGGLLVQSPDTHRLQASALKVVTRRQPTPQQLADLLFAWQVAHYVKSNAIVYGANGQTLGIGAGQMSRVDSARIASIKAANAGLDLQGSVVASDAFFPFRDGLDVVVDGGATAVIQPGGSVRDQEVIDAANERDVCMVFTGVRHFRH